MSNSVNKSRRFNKNFVKCNISENASVATYSARYMYLNQLKKYGEMMFEVGSLRNLLQASFKLYTWNQHLLGLLHLDKQKRQTLCFSEVSQLIIGQIVFVHDFGNVTNYRFFLFKFNEQEIPNIYIFNIGSVTLFPIFIKWPIEIFIGVIT